MRRRDDFAQRFIDAMPKPKDVDLNVPEQLVSVRLLRLAQILNTLDGRAIGRFEDVGLKTSDDMRTLALLRSAGSKGMTNTELMRELGGSKAGMSSRLNRLTKHGSVTRGAATSDLRHHRQVLTEAGAQLADRAFAAVFNERSKLLSSFDQDLLTDLAVTLSDLIYEVAPMTEPVEPDIYASFATWTAYQWGHIVPQADTSAAKVAIRLTEVSAALRLTHATAIQPWANDGVHSIEDFRILGLLRHVGEVGIKLSGITEHLRFEAGTTSSRVNRLEKHGFVERRENPNDKRTRFVRLVEDRATEVDDMYRALVANHERFFSGLAIEEHRQLAELLSKI